MKASSLPDTRLNQSVASQSVIYNRINKCGSSTLLSRFNLSREQFPGCRRVDGWCGVATSRPLYSAPELATNLREVFTIRGRPLLGPYLL